MSPFLALYLRGVALPRGVGVFRSKVAVLVFLGVVNSVVIVLGALGVLGVDGVPDVLRVLKMLCVLLRALERGSGSGL